MPPMVPRKVYTLLYASLLYTPGYTPHTLPAVYSRVHCHPQTAVPEREALGSNLGISLGMRRVELSSLLRCEERCARLRIVTPLSMMRMGYDRIDEGTISH